MGDPTARQREVPRQLRKLVRGAREQCTRAVHESGARVGWTRVEVHEMDARVQVMHERYTSTRGARDWWCTSSTRVYRALR